MWDWLLAFLLACLLLGSVLMLVKFTFWIFLI
jgi:hypothetical protein